MGRAAFLPSPADGLVAAWTEEPLMSLRPFGVCVAFLGVLLTGGMARRAGDPPVPVVPVGKPALRQVIDHADFTGRTAAAQSVEVRARVTGYLVKAPFKEGSEIKAGDVLFEIDPRPYQAQYDNALAQVELHKASLKLAKLNNKRILEISRTPGAVSQQELDQNRAAVEEAEVRLKASQATLDIHKLNLDFTRVRSPINGKVSRCHLTPGNLVTQDQTLLTTIVSLEPMYVYFNMEERILLPIHRAINEGKVKGEADGVKPIHMGLQGEDGHPHEGTINFINNRIDTDTGGIEVRGVFANPRPAGGVALLLPGMFVRVRLPIGSPYTSLVLPDRAVVMDKGEAFVFVVTAKNTLERRPVQLGPQQDGGLRVVRSGVTAEDLVVLNASPGLKAGQAVQPKRTPVTEGAPKAPPSGQGQP
jgi:membrane fusion protein, multidrug efflux system